MESLTPFEIDLSSRRAKIVIDGQDVADRVRGLRLEADHRGVPLLTLYGVAAGTVVGEAVVQTAVDVDPGQVTAAFLRGIDPLELARVALARPDVDLATEGGLTRAMLNQLAEWATGA